MQGEFPGLSRPEILGQLASMSMYYDVSIYRGLNSCILLDIHLRHTIVHRHVVTRKCIHTSKVSFLSAILCVMLERIQFIEALTHMT